MGLWAEVWAETVVVGIVLVLGGDGGEMSLVKTEWRGRMRWRTRCMRFLCTCSKEMQLDGETHSETRMHGWR